MIEPEYQKLASNIKRLRERSGLSQVEASRLIGLSRISITNIEAGRQRMAYHKVLRLLRALRTVKKPRCLECGHVIDTGSEPVEK